MTGNVLTTNPVTGTTAYANGAYGIPQQGFWGNPTGFGVNTPVTFGTPVYQPQGTYPIHTIGTAGGFIPQTVQTPGFLGQTIGHTQGGFITTPQVGIQGLINSALQTTPPEVLNTILQTTHPQVLPYILNALACQQVCQQVLAQNPQAVLSINPQAITQPFFQPSDEPGAGFVRQHHGLRRHHPVHDGRPGADDAVPAGSVRRLRADRCPVGAHRHLSVRCRPGGARGAPGGAAADVAEHPLRNLVRG